MSRDAPPPPPPVSAPLLSLSQTTTVNIPHSHAKNHARSSQVLKPLINQLESSIQTQFRRIDRDHDQLKTKLDQNVSAMHRRIWKLKSKQTQNDLSNWHNKEDLRHYLTAMSLLGSSQNIGGRTFGKEKHSFFDNVTHFKDTLDQARARKKESYSKKLAKLGVDEYSKAGQFLWKQMDGKQEATSVTTIALTREKVEEKENSNNSSGSRPSSSLAVGFDDADLTADEEEALMKLAREDDLLSAGQGWQCGVDNPSETDSSALAKEALLRLTQSLSPSRPHSSPHVQSVGSPSSASIGRRIGEAIQAPRVFRKTADELEEEEEERQMIAQAERARKEAEEKRRKEQADREAKAKKADDAGAQQGTRSRYGQSSALGHGRDSAPRLSAESRRGSIGGASKGGSILASVQSSPLVSRRASIVMSGASSAIKVLSTIPPPKRPIAILPDKPSPTHAAGSGMSEEQFAAEAARVMSMVLSNSTKFLQVSGAAASSANNPPPPLDSDRSSRSTSSGTTTSPLPVNRSAADSQRRHHRPDPNWTLQDEIDTWNSRTPATARSIEGSGNTKSILALAAEKLGVQSVASVGATTGGLARGPPVTEKDIALVNQAYRQSFEARHARNGGMRNVRPASASPYESLSPRGMHGRPRKPITNFGHSATSTTTNLTSIAHAIDFKEPKGRKELVALADVVNPAHVFAGVGEGKLGSTLMSFDQLHAANRTLADEQRRRLEAAALAKMTAGEIQPSDVKKVSEKEMEEVLRDRLAEKSRQRAWIGRDGEQKKGLTAVSSTGHLTEKLAKHLNELGPISDGPRPTVDSDGNDLNRTHLSTLPDAHSPLKSLQPSTSMQSFFAKKDGRDYVHLSPALIVPKWNDVTRVVDYPTLVPGYQPPPVEQHTPTNESDTRVTHEHGHDEDGFPITTITTTEADGSVSIKVVKGSSSSPPPQTPLTPLALSGLNGSTMTHLAPPPMPSIASPSTSAVSHSPVSPGLDSPTPAQPSEQDQARAARKALDAQLMSKIDFDLFPTPSARKLELKRLRIEALTPSPCSQGPSIFQTQKYVGLKHTYTKFVDHTIDRAVQKRGAIGAQKIQPVSGRIFMHTTPSTTTQHTERSQLTGQADI